MASAFVTPPGRNDTRSATADWMELQALRSSRRRSTIGDLISVLDIVDDDAARDDAFNEDGETADEYDESILETQRNRLIDPVFDELQYRKRVLSDVYPFSVHKNPPSLERVDGVTSASGRVVYLFCLLASAIRENRVQPDDLTRHARHEIANLFQVCACLAAGGYIAGEVASFGFPRSSGTSFIAALRATYERFGAGVVREPMPGDPTSMKDDGIDVIAWRDHPDRMPGKLYLLGQCASGSRWQEKSVVDRIHQFHGWFSIQPAAHCQPSMFIPFTLHRDLPDDPTTTFDKVLANRHLRDERRYGIVFDRFRIAHFAGACLQVNQDNSLVDGRDRFDDVKTWVEDTLEIPGMAKSA